MGAGMDEEIKETVSSPQETFVALLPAPAPGNHGLLPLQ